MLSSNKCIEPHPLFHLIGLSMDTAYTLPTVVVWYLSLYKSNLDHSSPQLLKYLLFHSESACLHQLSFCCVADYYTLWAGPNWQEQVGERVHYFSTFGWVKVGFLLILPLCSSCCSGSWAFWQHSNSTKWVAIIAECCRHWRFYWYNAKIMKPK